MSKVLLTISVDDETMKQFKVLLGKGNVSSDIDAYMKSRIQQRSAVISPVDAEILALDLKKAKEEAGRAAADLRTLEERSESIQRENEDLERARLVFEKEAIENALKCKKCGNLVNEARAVKLRDGLLCRPCFYALDGESAKALGL